MTLRKMTLLVVGLTFLGLIVVLTITLEVTLIRHFNEVEQQTVHQNIQRAQTALESDFAYLEMLAKDLARREETLQFFRNGDPSFLQNNFTGQMFQDHQINLLVLLTPQGELVAGQAYDLEKSLSQTLPQQFANGMDGSDPLTGGELAGMLALPEGALMVASRAVTQAGSGPSAGTVIVGRWLNPAEVRRLGTMMSVPMHLFRYNDPNLDLAVLAARSALVQNGGEYASPVDEMTMAGYRLVHDLYGQPAYLLRVEQSRTIYQNGRIVMNYLAISLALAGLGFGLMTLLMLERLVLSRLTVLSREVGAIRSSGNIASRVSVGSQDELSSVCQGINGLLATLEEMEASLHQRVAELRALNDASQVFLTETSSAGILQNACKLAVSQFGVESAWIGSVSADEQHIEPEAASGALPEHGVMIAWGAPEGEVHPAAAAVRRSEPVCWPVLDGAEGWRLPGEVAFRSMAALPLVMDGATRAVFCLYSRQPGYFSADKVNLLASLTNLAGMALQNAQLFEQVLAGRQRLQVLSRRLVEVQEEERRAIALELHDEIGQILTGLKLLLDTGAATPGDLPVQRLSEAREVVNDLIQRVRQLSLDLRPAMLDDLGLLPALVWLFERYRSQTQVQVVFQQQDLDGQRFSPEMETAAYRVVQEALTNVARYAGVNEVVVRLWNDGRVLGIQVVDHGSGFEPEAALSTGNSRGLLGMRERAYSLGGRMTIESAAGQGTCLTVELPLAGYLERRRNAR